MCSQKQKLRTHIIFGTAVKTYIGNGHKRAIKVRAGDYGKFCLDLQEILAPKSQHSNCSRLQRSGGSREKQNHIARKMTNLERRILSSQKCGLAAEGSHKNLDMSHSRRTQQQRQLTNNAGTATRKKKNPRKTMDITAYARQNPHVTRL